MTELTREQIEQWRLMFLDEYRGNHDSTHINTLCDAALASLTEREEGFRQGLEAAAKIAIKHPSSSGFDIAKDIRSSRNDT